MAEDILSQDEIDALLTGVDEGDIETATERGPGEYIVYDLSSQDKIVRSRLPTLDVVNERLAKHLNAALFSILKRSCEVHSEPLRVLKYSDYIESLQAPVSLNLVELQPLRGNALIVLEQGLIFKLVDIFFGGEGYEPKLSPRDFTPTENRLIDRILQHALTGIDDAWKRVARLRCVKTGAETNPAMVSIAASNDAIIINVFRIQIDGFSGELHFAIPYAMIDPVKDALLTTSKTDSDSPEASWSAALRRDILRANVELGCTVCEREISLRDVVDLEEGDIIPIEISEQLLLEANGAPIFKVKLGKSRGNLALEIVERANIADLG